MTSIHSRNVNRCTKGHTSAGPQQVRQLGNIGSCCRQSSLQKRKPRPGETGANGQKAGHRGVRGYLPSEFTLTAVSPLAAHHSVAKDHRDP